MCSPRKLAFRRRSQEHRTLSEGESEKADADAAHLRRLKDAVADDDAAFRGQPDEVKGVHRSEPRIALQRDPRARGDHDAGAIGAALYVPETDVVRVLDRDPDRITLRKEVLREPATSPFPSTRTSSAVMLRPTGSLTLPILTWKPRIRTPGTWTTAAPYCPSASSRRSPGDAPSMAACSVPGPGET